VLADFEEDISWLRGKVWMTSNINGQISDNFKFNFRENGININLVFDGLNSNPPQCTIGSDTTTPITGASPTFINEVSRPFG
jgi:hypothetical protein